MLFISLFSTICFKATPSLHETFLEAVPTTLIITGLMMYDNVIYFRENKSLEFFEDFLMFILTFTTSVISASFGLSKCLKVGAASIISDKGPLDGLLSLRFILSLFGKCSWED